MDVRTRVPGNSRRWSASTPRGTQLEPCSVAERGVRALRSRSILKANGQKLLRAHRKGPREPGGPGVGTRLASGAHECLQKCAPAAHALCASRLCRRLSPCRSAASERFGAHKKVYITMDLSGDQSGTPCGLANSSWKNARCRPEPRAISLAPAAPLSRANRSIVSKEIHAQTWLAQAWLDATIRACRRLTSLPTSSAGEDLEPPNRLRALNLAQALESSCVEAQKELRASSVRMRSER